MLLRHEIGDALRQLRQERWLTLRDVSAKSSVALGYLSEVERGTKEVSSEVLNSILSALDLELDEFIWLLYRQMSKTSLEPLSLV